MKAVTSQPRCFRFISYINMQCIRDEQKLYDRKAKTATYLCNWQTTQKISKYVQHPFNWSRGLHFFLPRLVFEHYANRPHSPHPSLSHSSAPPPILPSNSVLRPVVVVVVSMHPISIYISARQMVPCSDELSCRAVRPWPVGRQWPTRCATLGVSDYSSIVRRRRRTSFVADSLPPPPPPSILLPVTATPATRNSDRQPSVVCSPA